MPIVCCWYGRVCIAFPGEVLAQEVRFTSKCYSAATTVIILILLPIQGASHQIFHVLIAFGQIVHLHGLRAIIIRLSLNER